MTNQNPLLNDFMRQLVGNIRQEQDAAAAAVIKIVMSDDNARTHDLRRCPPMMSLSSSSSSSSHTTSSRSSRRCRNNMCGNTNCHYHHPDVVAPFMNDCSSAPLRPTRKQSVCESSSSPTVSSAEGAELPPPPSSTPCDSMATSTYPFSTSRFDSNIISKPSPQQPLLLRRSVSDDGVVPVSNIDDSNNNNIGVTRWQDEATFSSDSQMISAPPRAPASDDSPYFLTTKRSSRKTINKGAPKNRKQEGRTVAARKTTARNSALRISSNSHKELLMNDHPLQQAWRSSSSCCSCSSDPTSSSPPATTSYPTPRRNATMSRVEALEKALDVARQHQPQQRTLVVEA